MVGLQVSFSLQVCFGIDLAWERGMNSLTTTMAWAEWDKRHDPNIFGLSRHSLGGVLGGVREVEKG